MATENFTVVKGSYGYNLNFTLKDSAGTARNMTGYSAKLQVWAPLTPSTLLIDAACSWTDITAGTCYYTVPLATTFATVGVYAYAIVCYAEGIVDPALAGFISVIQGENGYCTIEEVKAELDITSAAHDNIIQRLIPQAKTAIENYCDRVFEQVAATRYYDGSEQPLTIDDLASISGASDGIFLDEDGDGTFEETLSTSDYNLYPYNSYPKNRVYLSHNSTYGSFAAGIRRGVKITATWGWTSIPEPVRRAAIIQVSRWFKRRESAYADVIGSVDTGQMTVYKGLDPDIKLLLHPYIRMWGVK